MKRSWPGSGYPDGMSVGFDSPRAPKRLHGNPRGKGSCLVKRLVPGARASGSQCAGGPRLSIRAGHPDTQEHALPKGIFTADDATDADLLRYRHRRRSRGTRLSRGLSRDHGRCSPSVRRRLGRSNPRSRRQRRPRNVGRVHGVEGGERWPAGCSGSMESASRVAPRAMPGRGCALPVRRSALAAVHPLGAARRAGPSLPHRAAGAPRPRPVARLPRRPCIPRTPRYPASRQPTEPLRHLPRSAMPVGLSGRRVLRTRLRCGRMCRAHREPGRCAVSGHGLPRPARVSGRSRCALRCLPGGIPHASISGCETTRHRRSWHDTAAIMRSDRDGAKVAACRQCLGGVG